MESTESANKELLFAQSSTFHRTSRLDKLPPDVVLVSTDNVLFSVHAHRLLRLSNNHFAGLLWKSFSEASVCSAFLAVDDNASVLTVVLHIIYEMYSDLNSFGFDELAAAIASLRRYGVQLEQLIAPRTPLMERLLGFAPVRGIELFAIAAQNDLESLAIPVSSHLLSYPIAEFPDHLASRMTSRYLKRLYDLKVNRMAALRDLLLMPPEGHPPSAECGFEERIRLVRAWALAAARFAWDAAAGTSQNIKCATRLTYTL